MSGGGAQDILDDANLFNALQSFLESDTEHVVHESTKFQDPAVRQVWSALADSRKSLATLFIVRTMRPPARVLPVSRFSVSSSRMRPTDNREPLDVDRADAEELVEYLDVMACATFSNVSEEVITSSILGLGLDLTLFLDRISLLQQIYSKFKPQIAQVGFYLVKPR